MEEYLGKLVKVAYNDDSSVSIKLGILKKYDDKFLYLEIKGEVIFIPISRIVRVEVKDDR